MISSQDERAAAVASLHSLETRDKFYNFHKRTEFDVGRSIMNDHWTRSIKRKASQEENEIPEASSDYQARSSTTTTTTTTTAEIDLTVDLESIITSPSPLPQRTNRQRGNSSTPEPSQRPEGLVTPGIEYCSPRKAAKTSSFSSPTKISHLNPNNNDLHRYPHQQKNYYESSYYSPSSFYKQFFESSKVHLAASHYRPFYGSASHYRSFYGSASHSRSTAVKEQKKTKSNMLRHLH